MPIYREITLGIREKHTAYRLQVELSSDEDVSKMRPIVFFTVQVEATDGTALSEPVDQTINPLILDPSQDQELANAIKLIQLKIGRARHAQLHAPPAPVDEEPSPFVSPE